MLYGERDDLKHFLTVPHTYRRSQSNFIFNKSSAKNDPHYGKSTVVFICEQQRRRSACASTQSDQRLCCSLLSNGSWHCFTIRVTLWHYGRDYATLLETCDIRTLHHKPCNMNLWESILDANKYQKWDPLRAMKTFIRWKVGHTT